MTAGITHTHVSAVADDPTKDVSSGEWNDPHVIPDGVFIAAKTAFTATDKVLGRSTAGAGNGEEIALTAAGRALLDDADAAAQRTTLGLGTVSKSIWLPAAIGTIDAGTITTQGVAPDKTAVVNLADAATQGHYWTFMVPWDWASGVLTVQPVWGPSATDATSHSVAWSMDTKELAAGIDVSAAGTTVAWTGAAGARTVKQVVYDTATSTGVTPSGPNKPIMFNLRRVGADGADTYVGVVQFLGVIVTYTANR